MDTSILPVPRSADASGKTVGASPVRMSDMSRRYDDWSDEEFPFCGQAGGCLDELGHGCL